MTTQDIAKRNESAPAVRENTRSSGRVLTPAVDIFESDDTLTLVADMPGVEKENLDINLEQGVLTISAEMDIEQRGQQLFREFTPAGYYRQFRLSEHIDAEKTQAELKHGVLTLQLPKAESAKPKKIAIRH